MKTLKTDYIKAISRAILIGLALYIVFFGPLPGTSTAAYAEQSIAGPTVTTEDVTYAFQRDVECSLSKPTFTREADGVVYKTTLSLKDMTEFYGYQIQVVSARGDAVEIEDMAGGVTTPTVYKYNKASFAAIVGEGASGNIEVCEITSKYPYKDKSRDRTLVVDKLDIVTSIAAERTITLGPLPAALTLALPYVAPPFYAAAWFPVLPILGILGLALCCAYLYKRNKNRPLSQPAQPIENNEGMGGWES